MNFSDETLKLRRLAKIRRIFSTPQCQTANAAASLRKAMRAGKNVFHAGKRITHARSAHSILEVKCEGRYHKVDLGDPKILITK